MLITDGWREQNRLLHEQDAGYGRSSGVNWTDWTRHYVRRNPRVRTILDYGCGKGALKEQLGSSFRVAEYDPAIPGKDAPPAPADLVICTDVLEHVEAECLDSVLAHLFELARHSLLLDVSCAPGKRTVPDGRLCHIHVQTRLWWLGKLIQLPGSWHVVNGKLEHFTALWRP